MSNRRNIYKYYFKRGNKILHAGITNDLERREQEHQQEFGEKCRISQQGHRTTREGALRWEDEQRKQGKPVGP